MTESKAERTRRFIIEKSAPVFNKKGYSGTSLSDLTSATGLTKGSIYGNFKNKDEVAVAVFHYNVKRLTDQIRRELKKHHSTLDKLLAYVNVYRKLYGEFDNGGCPVLNTSVEADDAHPLLKTEVKEVIESWKNSFMILINKGKELGEIKPDVDTERTVTTIICMIEGGVMLTQALKDRKNIHVVVDQLEEMIKNDLAT